MIIVRRRVTNKQANFGIGSVLKKPFTMLGKKMAESARNTANSARYHSTMNPGNVGSAQRAANTEAYARLVEKYPARIAGINVGAAILGAGAGYGVVQGAKSFARRRRTKNGKIVVEQVNRK
jgi:hypothetical protein